MEIKTFAADVLAAFAKDVGVDRLELDPANTAMIAFAETHELIFHLVPERGGFQLWSPFHHVSLSDDASTDLSLLKHVLQQNFPSVALGGSYFALDETVGIVLLGRFVQMDKAGYAHFIEETKDFASQVVQIAAGLKDAMNVASDDALEPAEDDLTVMRV